MTEASSMAEKVVIGDATLYHGDCMDVLPTLEKVDLVMADPNYGIGESGKKNKTRGKPFGSRVDSKNTRGTFVPPIDYGDYEWDEKPATKEQIYAFVRAGKYAAIWGGNYFNLPPSQKWLVWDKLNSGDFADCELAWTNIPGAVRIIRHMWNGMLRQSERNTPRVHPTQKPVAVIAWAIQQSTVTESVLDPMMGSGTTGVACMNLGRKFIGIELERKYFDIACERIEQAQRQLPLFGRDTPREVYDQTQLDYT